MVTAQLQGVKYTDSAEKTYLKNGKLHVHY